MLDFVRSRAHGPGQIAPTIQEIQILEVYKKLTESGWIVKESEVSQIL